MQRESPGPQGPLATPSSTHNPGFTQGRLPAAVWLGHCCHIISFFEWLIIYKQRRHLHYFWPTMHSIYRFDDRDKFTHHVHSSTTSVHPHASGRVSLPLGLYLSSGLVRVLDSWHCGDGKDSRGYAFRLHLSPGLNHFCFFSCHTQKSVDVERIQFAKHSSKKVQRAHLIMQLTLSCDSGIVPLLFPTGLPSLSRELCTFLLLSYQRPVFCCLNITSIN